MKLSKIELSPSNEEGTTGERGERKKEFIRLRGKQI